MKELIEYFEQGCKSLQEPFRLGLELEHFIVEKSTKKSVDFYGEFGVEAILKELRPKFQNSVHADGYLISLEREDLLITIEPAGQLEVSITPKERISEIEKIYQEFTEDIRPILDSHGYVLENRGYQPASKVNDLSRMPKKRYKYMESHFNQMGRSGKYMMKGTGAIHVSIDYTSEQDFSAKYKLAYLLSPMIAFVMENTPVFEGERYEKHLLRDTIWREVDPIRFQTESFWQDEKMTFAGYAEFVSQVPLVLDISSGKDRHTKSSAKEIYVGKNMSRKDVEHVLSMVFPEVRLKQYIEIRTADSNNIERTIRYLRWIRMIFGDSKYIEELLALLSFVSIQDVAAAKSELREKGGQAVIYGRPVAEWLAVLKMEDLSYEYERF